MRQTIIFFLVLVLGSLSAIGQPAEPGSATSGSSTVEPNNIEGINSALREGNAHFVPWDTMDYSQSGLDYSLINSYSALVDGNRYLESFGAKDVKFSRGIGSGLTFGPDGTLSVEKYRLTAKEYKIFPDGTEIKAIENRIKVIYPAGGQVVLADANSDYVINAEKGVVLDGINVKGQLHVKDQAAWLDSSAKIEIDGYPIIENNAQDSAKLNFNGCTEGAVCIYEDKLMGEGKNLRIVDKSGIEINIENAKFSIQEQLKPNEIIRLQKLLNQLGYTDYEGKKLVADGIIGPRTKSAVEKYQMNLVEQGYLSGEANGIPDPGTIRAINQDVGPWVYIDGIAEIKNSGKEDAAVLSINNDNVRLKPGDMSNNFVLNTPNYASYTYGSQRWFTDFKDDNAIMTGYREGRFNNGQALINYAYQLAGGNPEKAAQIIKDSTGYTLDDLTKRRQDKVDWLFEASAIYYNRDVMGLPNLRKAMSYEEGVNELVLLNDVAYNYKKWIPDSKRISKIPERDGRIPGHSYVAFDISAKGKSPVLFPDLKTYIGEDIYGVVRYRGTDAEMDGAGYHYFIELYYTEDGQPVFNKDGEQVGMLTMHHQKFDKEDASLRDKVEAGKQFARIGHSGESSGNHVHVEFGSWNQLIANRAKYKAPRLTAWQNQQQSRDEQR